MIKIFLISLFLFASHTSQMVYDFSKKSDAKYWVIVDDVVMGGRSNGSFYINKDGHGVFEGSVSTENYGGFSSVRYRSTKTLVNNYSAVILRVKGDGKNYQFRLKANTGDYFSYITTFETTGKWQEIAISLKDLYPSYRGRELSQPNFSSPFFEEITFLIGNKKNEQFRLEIDKIELQ